MLTKVWSERSIEIAERVVRGLFPTADARRPTGGAGDGRAAREWLASHTGAAPALRRCLDEEVDDLERRLRAQRAE